MVYPKQDLKKYYLPLYLIWIVLGPSLLLLANYPYEKSMIEAFFTNQDYALSMRLISFYAIFGVVWPLMIVIYPAFYDSLLIKFQYNSLGEALSNSEFWIPFIWWAIAFYGPFIGLIIAFILHKKEVEARENEEITWKTFFTNFI